MRTVPMLSWPAPPSHVDVYQPVSAPPVPEAKSLRSELACIDCDSVRHGLTQRALERVSGI